MGMYAFYVYSHREAPDASLGLPFVKFHNLKAHSGSSTKTDEELQDYEGVQLSIVPYADFKALIYTNQFCSTKEDEVSQRAEKKDQLLVVKPAGVTSHADLNIYMHTVHFPKGGVHPEKDVQVPVRATDVYILVFSNCGDFKDATVSGSVIVKNAYGFLPGNEYHKMPFYGWLSIFYTFMAVLWMGLSLRWWRELIHIQYCIAVVIFLGLVEGFLWWEFFNNWNKTGTRGGFLFTVAILSSTVKSIFSYMLVLVAALGWGVTRPYLDHKTLLKVQGVSVLFIILDFIRGSVLSFRHSHSFSLIFVLLCLMPVAMLNGAIFYWIFTALSSLMETLQERRQLEKLVLFTRLWKILIFALGMASLTLLFLVCDLSRSISIRWHYQWFLTDGVSHVLFLLVLAAMMYLWAPHNNSGRYAYSPAVTKNKDKGEGKNEQPSWVEEDLPDEGAEDESFWSATRGGEGGSTTKSETATTSDV